MKVLQVVPHVHREASGPSYSVPALCRSLQDAGASVTLHVLEPGPSAGTLADWPFGVQVWRERRFPPKLGRSPAMCRGLQEAARDAAILHTHSLWMMPNIYPAGSVRGTDCRLVVAPRGTLAPAAMQRRRWFKLALWPLQRQVLRKAQMFHATADSELQQIRAAGFRQPVAVLPNGVDVPEDVTAVRPVREFRRLLFLGRVHPIKGVPFLLGAWARLQGRFADWELHIAGPAEAGYQAELTAMTDRLGLKRVTFVGPLHGAEKSAAYRAADLYVLPTHTENFGITVAEALAHASPVVVTRGAPWSGVEREDCGWWIDVGENPLYDCLSAALAETPDALQARGARGREWMRRDFAWPAIGRRMLACYEWLRGTGSPPTAWPPTDPPVPTMRPTLAVIIPTFNEELNLPAALDSLKGWADEVFVVDSYSTDRTVDIALEREADGVRVVQHTFVDYAQQWNWALQRLPITAQWTMKLDADERVPAALQQEVNDVLAGADDDLAGLFIRHRMFFTGAPVLWGGFSSVYHMRIWRTAGARFEDRAINEHALVEGRTVRLRERFDHRDHKSLSDWLVKHDRYTSMEARAILEGNVTGDVKPSPWGTADQRRMFWRRVYRGFPFRHVGYFLYRYVWRLGFLSGRAGFRYSFLHASAMYWIDLKIAEARRTGVVPEVAWPARGTPHPVVAGSALQKQCDLDRNDEPAGQATAEPGS